MLNLSQKKNKSVWSCFVQGWRKWWETESATWCLCLQTWPVDPTLLDPLGPYMDGLTGLYLEPSLYAPLLATKGNSIFSNILYIKPFQMTDLLQKSQIRLKLGQKHLFLGSFSYLHSFLRKYYFQFPEHYLPNLEN